MIHEQQERLFIILLLEQRKNSPSKLVSQDFLTWRLLQSYNPTTAVHFSKQSTLRSPLPHQEDSRNPSVCTFSSAKQQCTPKPPTSSHCAGTTTRQLHSTLLDDNTDCLEPQCWDPIHFFNSSGTSRRSTACPFMTLNVKLADQYHLKKLTLQRQNCSFRRKIHFLSALRTAATSRWCFWNVRALLPYNEMQNSTCTAAAFHAGLHAHCCSTVTANKPISSEGLWAERFYHAPRWQHTPENVNIPTTQDWFAGRKTEICNANLVNGLS